MRRRIVAVVALAVVAALGFGVAAAAETPRLRGHGPTAVSGTEASAVFGVGDRTIRQVRYDDKGTLVYTFRVANDGRLPVTVTGLAPMERAPRLFRYLAITDDSGHREFTIAPGESASVHLSMRMQSCETLSARAGSFATEANLQTSRAGVLSSVVRVRFPEEVHTGSPREAFCPAATARSRAQG